MIDRFKDFDNVKGYGEFKQLPKGGYILVIKNASIEQSSNGKYIRISCDIAEGDYKDFFMDDYRAQNGEDKKWRCNYLLNIPKDDGSERDGWTKRSFKTFTDALEDSNSGYHFDWDEQKFKGKLIGGLFNIRQYKSRNGDIRESTNLKRICTVAMIREQTYKLPNDDLLKEERTASSGDAPWMDIPETEAPFN